MKIEFSDSYAYIASYLCKRIGINGFNKKMVDSAIKSISEYYNWLEVNTNTNDGEKNNHRLAIIDSLLEMVNFTKTFSHRLLTFQEIFLTPRYEIEADLRGFEEWLKHYSGNLYQIDLQRAEKNIAADIEMTINNYTAICHQVDLSGDDKALAKAILNLERVLNNMDL